MAGTPVGCLVGDGVQDVDKGARSCSSPNFKALLKVHFAELLKEFAKIGVSCDEFQIPGGAANAAADTPMNLKLEEQQVIKTQE